jgi:hypothetical protein
MFFPETDIVIEIKPRELFYRPTKHLFGIDDVLVGGLIGAGIGASAGGGKVKGEGFKKIPLTEEQKRAERYLGELLEGRVKFEPRKIAEFSPAMQKAIEMVNNIMEGGIPEIEQAIKVTVDRMMGEPETVPGLEGLFERTKEMGADLLGRTQRGLALTGNLPSESSAGEMIYGRTLRDIMNELITAAYPFYAQGLAEKYKAPQQLANLGVMKTTIPLNLATTVGKLPMEREQSVLDAIMEATRKTKEFPFGRKADIASSLLKNPMYAYNPGTYVPSTLSQIAQPLAMLGSAAIMSGGKGVNTNQFNPYSMYDWETPVLQWEGP